jgi:serine/threonine-protein kinase
VRAALPPGLDEWFARALHRNRHERFGSAKEMAIALARVIPSAVEDYGEENSSIIYAAPSSPGASPSQAGMLESGPSLVLASPTARLGLSQRARPFAILGVATAALLLGAALLVLLRSPAPPDGEHAATESAGSSDPARATSEASAAEATGAGTESIEPAPSALPAATGEVAAGADAGADASSGYPPGQPWPKGRRGLAGREDYGF